MNWLDFIDKLIAHLVWPLTLLVILLLPRRYLGGIFQLLKTLKLPGGVELELQDQFRELREEAQAAKLASPSEAKVADLEEGKINDDEQAKFLRMAEDFPQAAIMQSWMQLERLVFNVVAPFKQTVRVSTDRPILLNDALRDLRFTEHIDEATLNVLNRLRNIRNEVVHAKREAVTPGEALEFQELSKAVSDKLRQIRP